MSDLTGAQKLYAGNVTAPAEPLSDIDAALEHAELVIGQRVAGRIGPELTEHLRNAGIREFVVFGGACLRGAPADLDLAASAGDHAAFTALATALKSGPDSQFGTLVADGVPVQLCLTERTTIEAFIETFDFAHCKVGVKLAWDGKVRGWEPKGTYIGHEFAAAMMTQGTFYTGGTWPLRSLARTAKVAEKLELNTDECHALALQVVKHIYTQGLDATVKADQNYMAFLGVPDTTKAAPDEGGPAAADSSAGG